MDSREAREILDFTRSFSRRGLIFDGLELVSATFGQQAFFERCSFVDTDLRQATLDGASFKFCDFRGANLRGASLRNTRLAGCDLRGADLDSADLTGARLVCANSGSEDIGRTDVTGALFDRAVLLNVVTDNVVGWQLH